MGMATPEVADTEEPNGSAQFSISNCYDENGGDKLLDDIFAGGVSRSKLGLCAWPLSCYEGRVWLRIEAILGMFL